MKEFINLKNSHHINTSYKFDPCSCLCLHKHYHIIVTSLWIFSYSNPCVTSDHKFLKRSAQRILFSSMGYTGCPFIPSSSW